MNNFYAQEEPAADCQN